ncbi:KDGP aldolase family protein [Erwinia aphidicola]|nr:KDGP aldolase family protein [Erwinia aphidicola]
MTLKPKFYRDRVCLNVLAGSKQNARDIWQAAEGHVLVGVLSKDYPDVASAVADMRDYAALIDNALSVGLGAGDPNQSAMVSAIAVEVQPQHVNQVFTGVATSRALLGQSDTVVNGLISPTGTVGKVKISTGPLSSQQADGIVPVATAVALLKDMGGSSVKYFPMGGLKAIDEFKAVAEACAAQGFWLEPTGGIDLDNYEAILQIALDAGVSRIIPHIYSSIIDKQSGQTRPQDVATLLAMTKKVSRLILTAPWDYAGARYFPAVNSVSLQQPANKVDYLKKSAP